VLAGERPKFLNFEGLPSDYYLRLAGTAIKMTAGKISTEAAIAFVANLQNKTTAER
jgi:hypothetical protein